MNNRHIHHLAIGEVHAGRDSTEVSTVLGSCISVCLYDPGKRVGGINHILLPSAPAGGLPSTSYGVLAMQELLSRLRACGARREALIAKVFGGANMLVSQEDSRLNIGHLNRQFTKAYLADAQIPIVGMRVGGNGAIQLRFVLESGRAHVKELSSIRNLSPEVKPGRPWHRA